MQVPCGVCRQRLQKVRCRFFLTRQVLTGSPRAHGSIWQSVTPHQHDCMPCCEQLLYANAACSRQLQQCCQASQAAGHTLFPLCLCCGVQVVTAHRVKAVPPTKSALQAATAVHAEQGGAWVQTTSAECVLLDFGPVLMLGMGTMGVVATCCGPAPIARSFSLMAWPRLWPRGPAVPVSVYAR